MKKLIFSLVCLSLMSTGCGSFGTKIDEKLLNENLTKSYNSSKVKSYNATIAALKTLNWY